MQLSARNQFSGSVKEVKLGNIIISNNQTFTDVFTRKPINIDRAHVTVRPSKTFGLEKAFFQYDFNSALPSPCF